MTDSALSGAAWRIGSNMRAVVLALIASCSFIAPACAEQNSRQEVAKAARSAVRFMAIKGICPEEIPTDKDRAEKFIAVFTETGVKFVGKAEWNRLTQQEFLPLIAETREVGPRQWCEAQRRSLREAGERQVFP